MTIRSGKTAYLEGIRGFAAFFVFLHHFALIFYMSHYDWRVATRHLPDNLEVRYGRSVLSVFTNGNFWVNVFFVLSGLVLSRKYFLTGSVAMLVSGAQRRFFRLYIPATCTIIISWTLIETGLFFNTPVSDISGSYWFSHMWQFPDIGPRFLLCLTYGTVLMGDQLFNTVLWTMPVEFFYSLFVFAFLALTHHTKNRLFSLILVLVYSFLFDAYFLAPFAMGVGLCYLEGKEKTKQGFATNFLAFLLLLLGLFLGSYPTEFGRKDTLFDQLGHTLLEYSNWFHPVGAFLVVLAFVVSPFFQRMASLRIFRFLGHVSFPLYLLHMLVLGSLGSYAFLKIYPLLGYNYTVLAVFLISTVFLLIFSWLMTRYIDGPGIRFSKFVFDRWITVKEDKEIH